MSLEFYLLIIKNICQMLSAAGSNFYKSNLSGFVLFFVVGFFFFGNKSVDKRGEMQLLPVWGRYLGMPLCFL